MNALQVIMAFLPFVVLFIGFIVFKMDALKLSLIVLVLELLICGFLYGMGPLKMIEASLWGNITLWTGFLVLWTGQVFGSCYRNTGLLDVLLKTLGKILPTKEGKALTLATVVGGYVGAFNGFATYPVTIPGLKKMGFSGTRAAAAYLVYFAWNISFVSLWVAANIAAGASKIPLVSIVQTMGLIAMPLCISSTIGFFVILQFSLKDKDNLLLLVLTCIGNMLGIFLFTQVFPDLYLLSMVASATFCLLAVWLLSKKYDKSKFEEDADETKYTAKDIIKAFAPLLVCMILVILLSYPLKPLVTATTFSLSLFGYNATSVSLVNAPGTYVLITALVCYLFTVKKTAGLGKSIAMASKRSVPSLLTLLCGGAMVQLMLDTSQIKLLGDVFVNLGSMGYTGATGLLSFLCGIAFGQGMPAVRLLSVMQLTGAPAVGLAPVILIGLAAVICMGPANPLKPSLLKYTSSLADIKGEDGKIFNLNLPWEILGAVIALIMGVILILTGWMPVGLS